MSSKNPDWTREELILGLDLYFRAPPLLTTAQDPRVIELSEFLNGTYFHSLAGRERTFRNPTGVYMTLRGFLRWDSFYSGAGLQGGKLGREIWREFASDLLRLERTANAIRIAAVRLQNEPRLIDPSLEAMTFSEGSVLVRLHLVRERSKTMVAKKKKEVLRRTGRLACEVCNFDFEVAYGPLGRGFAECHHRIPLVELPEKAQSQIGDLAIVCSNCHSILHRARPWISVEDLSEQLFSSKKSSMTPLHEA